ncbi:putative ATPase [Ophidiomyces ophidiicola]|uniref:ATPase n=1 Tax=Ophidiomyces ophidiicola TaxID=1387563 RepID=A0ACB8UYL4_9EURO|nr:putative ATPase [Ophidiomyces ophidiicola]KAI1948056.1 putative ATPase [Ophidiomyces ophidiicola]KAI1948315.1 putative ATPase [Ophidiomyces ophidiicola]KAI1963220.1 putative ATPase [Ophidiomyces ophidiicola]KAI1999685.1 putative ATPase [Ophidiomyces ophidiicola]
MSSNVSGQSSIYLSSTPITSPYSGSPKNEDITNVGGADNDHGVSNLGIHSEDDEEDMDLKAKALTKLLKTSSVFVAIMAEKMKDQRKRQQEEARKAAAKKSAADQKKKKKSNEATSRRVTRANEKQAKQPQPTAPSKDLASEPRLPKALIKNQAKVVISSNSLTNYFHKADVGIPENNPTVQEALAQAAEEFESKPTTLGSQELVATQQPALVTGGRMRDYQLEGLEWLKSLWMNGLCGILADEMGLGKTVQAISLIAFFKEHKISGPFLIATPLSTLSNWVNEFARWTPKIKTVLYHGTKEDRAQIRQLRMKVQDQKNFDFPVVCTSYEICMNDRKFLADYQWKYIIVDEGHRLKNMNCRLIQELMLYNSANRLLLTGTPLQNNIAELWSLLHFLLPEVFSDLNSFQNWFDFSSILDSTAKKDIVEKRKQNLVSTMHAILKPFLLRRVKTDVETNLPKKREYILYAPLTPEQKELYLAIVQGTGRQYLEGKAFDRLEHKNASGRPSGSRSLKRSSTQSGSSTPNKSIRSDQSSTPGATLRRRGKRKTDYREISDREFNAKLRELENGKQEEFKESELSEDELIEIERVKTMQLARKEISTKKLQNPLMQARLACNSPHNFYWPWDQDSDVDESLVTASGKMLLLDRLVPFLLSRGHKILIFSQFKTQLNILQDWTYLRDWKCCRIDGDVNQSDRQLQIDSFNNDPDHRIFLLSTRAGGLGINLTAADTVILFDSDWNPQLDLQAQDRAHRIGQTKPVIVYRLASRGTVEQKVLESADSKRRLERLVIQKGKFKNLLDMSSTEQKDTDELRKILEGDRLEVFDVGAGSKPESLLSRKELEILTDRSEEAYNRAENGLDRSANTFLAVKKNRGGDVTDILKE